MPKRTADKKSAPDTRPGRLRIVAGNWRSRLLQIADVEGLRPTSERIRETLFNWLAPHIQAARCLDLFAGTGALGFEALSRGAASAVMIEQNSRAVATLRESARQLGASTATVHHGDAVHFLHNAAEASFDIVFIDPPFAENRVGELCRLIAAHSILAADARVYIEEDRDSSPAELPADWQFEKTKTAGKVRYSLLKPPGST